MSHIRITLLADNTVAARTARSRSASSAFTAA